MPISSDCRITAPGDELGDAPAPAITTSSSSTSLSTVVRPSSSAAAAAAARSNKKPTPPPRDESNRDRNSSLNDDDPEAVTARSSLLQPRVAVALGVPEAWHSLLFICRLPSIAPAIWWGLPSGIRLVVQLHLLIVGRGGFGPHDCHETTPDSVVASSAGGFDKLFEARLRFSETFLAIIWCCGSGYLSFVFTDCLMSRWLVNYTPQATLVRLLTVNALNGYITSWVLYATGGSEDPRLLLPAWITIATTLTILYHVTQRKINIRKETNISISVFSIASFLSMVVMLAQIQINRTDYPKIPLVTLGRWVWRVIENVLIKFLEYGNVTKEL